MPADFGTLTVAVAAPLAAGAGTAEAFADEHLKLIAYLAGTVVAVVAVIAWVDHRIAAQIDAKNAAQTARIIREVRAFQQLLAVRLGMPELMPQSEITDELKLGKR